MDEGYSKTGEPPSRRQLWAPVALLTLSVAGFGLLYLSPPPAVWAYVPIAGLALTALLLQRLGRRPQLPGLAGDASTAGEALGDVAVLVVHGIGRCQRYQTLDLLSSGLQLLACHGRTSVRPRSGYGALPDLVFLETPPTSTALAPNDRIGVQLMLQRGRRRRRVDLFELYWAPLAKHSYSASGVLRWLFSVLGRAWERFVEPQACLDAGVQPAFSTRGHRSRMAPHSLMRRKAACELLLLVGGCAALALSGYLVLSWMAHQALAFAQQAHISLPHAYGYSAALPLPFFNTPLATIQVTVAFLLAESSRISLEYWITAGLAGYCLLRLLSHLHQLSRAVTAWLQTTLGARRAMGPGRRAGCHPSETRHLAEVKAGLEWAAFYLAILLGVATWVRGGAPGAPHALAFAIAAFLAWSGTIWVLLHTLIADHLGDIPAYTGMDENTPGFEARRRIQEKARQMLGAVLEQYAGRRVLVVAHSLGAMVARDALRRLYLDSLRGETQAPMGEVVLVTCGAPLRKVQDFLDFQAPSNTLAALHGSFDREIFRGGVVPGRGLICWHNAWFMNDLVAGPLADRCPLIEDACVPWGLTRGASLLWTHGDYWRCPALLRGVVELLLRQRQAHLL